MTQPSTDAAAVLRSASTAPPAERSAAAGRWDRFPIVPFAFTVAFMAFVFVPPVAGNPRMVWTFLGVGAALLLWEALVWARARSGARLLRMEYVPVRSHWVQACVHSSVLAYWGWYARHVYVEVPLFAAQILFFYVMDALLSWSRGRTWRVGFGPFPIIFSTNLLLWFVDDWYVFQFAMLALGAVGKQFVTWTREGRRTHIFNPSVFGQGLFALALIATATTDKFTFGKEIAATFEKPPHIMLVIFLLGLIVQYFFEVTLMTLSAVATLCALNLVYTGATGSYWFVASNISAPIFLGMHLLVTDPSTSPRSNLGKLMFGAGYAIGYAVLFRLFDDWGVPLFWDKLLPVPVLNLCVPLIDRIARSGALGRFNHWWETVLPPRRMNLVHMGCWIALFTTMLCTGFVEAPHPGSSVEFWKQALEEGRPHAGRNLLRMAHFDAANGSGSASNTLGILYMEGKEVKADRRAAAHYFAQACRQGDSQGCANLARQYLFQGEAESEQVVTLAFDLLQRQAMAGTEAPNGAACFLVGYAYETGRSRPADGSLALVFYDRGCGLGDQDCCRAAARLHK